MACPLTARAEGNFVSVQSFSRSELNYGKSRDCPKVAEVQRRNYSSSGVFTS